MELKDFIQTALIDLVEGVNSAKEKLNDNICPSIGNAYSDKAKLVRDINGLYIDTVKFDIAVTVENSKQGGAKAGITVIGLNLGVGGETENTNATVSRIQFQVPVGLGKKAT